MAGRSSSSARQAERYFAVRVRVLVPPGGFGRQFDEMQGWLNLHVGRGSYFIGSETNPGIPDAALFYFENLEVARAFVERFACGIVLLRGRNSDRPQ